MKIGILTFFSSKDNYGQVLQAFALLSYLQSLGHEVFFVDYEPVKKKPVRKPGAFNYLKDLLRNYVVKNYWKYKSCIFSKKYPRDFSSFRKKYLPTSGILYKDYQQLQNNPPIADALICGSDQVWNTDTAPDSTIFFLNFGAPEIIRISYAPSFGRNNKDSNFIQFLSEQLKRFQAISVREEKGLEICKKAGFPQATHVIDPSLLLKANKYQTLFPKDNIWDKENKIFCYFLNIKQSKEVHWNKIRTYAKRNNSDIRLTISSGLFPATKLFGDIPYYAPSPEEWIHSIHQANYFISNSFHGIAFSIILHKEFIFMPFCGEREFMNERIFSLLSILKLQDRIYNPTKKIENQLEAPIDWISVDAILDKERQKSYEYIIKGLSN